MQCWMRSCACSHGDGRSLQGMDEVTDAPPGRPRCLGRCLWFMGNPIRRRAPDRSSPNRVGAHWSAAPAAGDQPKERPRQRRGRSPWRPATPKREKVLNDVIDGPLDQCLAAAIAITVSIDHQTRVDVVRQRVKHLARGPRLALPGAPTLSVGVGRDRRGRHLGCRPLEHARDDLALFRNHELLRSGIGGIAERHGAGHSASVSLQVRPRFGNSRGGHVPLELCE